MNAVAIVLHTTDTAYARQQPAQTDGTSQAKKNERQTKKREKDKVSDENKKHCGKHKSIYPEKYYE